MIYHGAYSNDNIYGTLDNRQVEVETDNDADFLICDLEVSFNGTIWEHRFEMPFFNNIAQFYFENYVHSIIIQKFNIQNINSNHITFYSFDIAAIKMKLKEMETSTILNEVEYNFFMILGNFGQLSMPHLNAGNQHILPIPHTRFLTANGFLTFSFLSNNYPNKLIVNDGLTNNEIPLATATTTQKLHTICIPVSQIMSLQSTSITMSLQFSGHPLHSLGEFYIIDDGQDHNIIMYQNQYGSISVIEFTGQVIQQPHYKFKSTQTIISEKQVIKTNDINYNVFYKINTGYWLDSNKYNMLDTLLKSFNIYINNGALNKIIVNRSQKLTRYKTNFYENNETITFKLSENDHPIYAAF